MGSQLFRVCFDRVIVKSAKEVINPLYWNGSDISNDQANGDCRKQERN